MAECIERDMLLKMISHKPSSPTTEMEDRLINGFISAVKNCPAADVRPVVLCRDCKHNCGAKTWIDGDITADCTNGHGYPPLDWFCADGKKREES